MGQVANEEDIGIEGGNQDDAGTVEEPSNAHAAVLANTKEIQFESKMIKAIRQAARDVDIAEVYSLKGVTKTADTLGAKPGEAMDLTNGWDFRLERHKEAALKYIREVKPKLIIGSPECRLFSTMQNLTKHLKKTNEQDKQMCEAIEHIRFVVRVYRGQAEDGRMFLHEHTAQASPWDLGEIRKMGQEI